MTREIPGTVSKILWHFTGGPAWNERLKRQARETKSPSDAYKALIGILESRVLRLGRYKEVIRVQIPRRQRRPLLSGRPQRRRVVKVLESAPVCCLADVPVIHLSYLAKRYGRFAIGFHRDAAIRNGFNPVFYTLHDAEVIRDIYNGFARINAFDMGAVRMVADDLEDAAHRSGLDLESDLDNLEVIADVFESDLEVSRDSLKQFLAFVKTFSRNDFQTIYCEREWRAIEPFKFDYGDVAMIVLPRYEGRGHYFAPFIKSRITALGLPRTLPIVAWEDLVES